jgi:hypothetical protein
MAQDKGYIQMRELIKRVRNADKGIEYKPKTSITEGGRNMSIREMKRRIRKSEYFKDDINEVDDNQLMGGKQEMSSADENKEQEKLQNFLRNNNVTIEFEPFEKYQNGVFWGGTIDGQIMFVYRVTPEEVSSGIDIEYLEGFDPNDPENNEIIEKLKRYYNDFYKYWRDSQIYSNDEDRL